jgi:hypothetical protein
VAIVAKRKKINLNKTKKKKKAAEVAETSEVPKVVAIAVLPKSEPVVATEPLKISEPVKNAELVKVITEVKPKGEYMGEQEHDHDDHKKEAPCGVVNFYCGDDKHPPHPPEPKKNCCDPCEAVLKGDTYVGFEDIGYISPVATEVPAELLVNPAGSGKLFYIRKRLMSSLGSDDNVCLFHYSFDPALNGPGILGTIVNLNTASSNVSVGQFYKLPNVSSNGTTIDAMAVGVTPFESDELLVLGEGHSLLVTYRANAENTRAGAFLYWTECWICRDEDEHHGGKPS